MHIIIKLIIAIVCTAATFTCVESASTVVELNEDNWESLTRGKTLWVKFCTKDCAHCKKMHIAWERLADAWVEVEVRSEFLTMCVKYCTTHQSFIIHNHRLKFFINIASNFYAGCRDRESKVRCRGSTL